MNNPAILQVFTSVVNSNHTFCVAKKYAKRPQTLPVLWSFIVKAHKAQEDSLLALLILKDGQKLLRHLFRSTCGFDIHEPRNFQSLGKPMTRGDWASAQAPDA